MATSLMDKLKRSQSKTTFRQDGQLRQSNNEELQQLTKAKGLQAPPTSPLAAQSIGASPDAAKMAGTPQQKKAALNLSSAPDASLSDVMRRSQGRTQQTEGETAQYEKSENLAKAGAIGDSVYNLIKSYLPQQATEQAEQVETYQVSLPPEVEAVLDDQTRQQLEQLALNPSVEAAAALAPALRAAGLSGDAENPLNYISSLNTGDVAANSLLDAEEVTVGNLFGNANMAETIGLEEAELAELLGTTPESLRTMNVTDFQDLVNRVEQKEFDRVDQLREIANSPTASLSEKRQARQLLRDAGSTGMVAADEKVDNLMQELETAGTVEFGGESYEIGDFLQDENISQLISEYLEGDEAAKAEFAQDFGSDFVAFVEKHREVLEDAAQVLETTQGSAKEIQEANRDLSNVEGYGTLSEEVMNTLVPGWNQFQGEKLEAPYMLQLLKGDSLSPEQKSNIMETLTDGGPLVAEMLKDMSLSELQQTGVLDNNSEWQGTKAKLVIQDQIDKFDLEDPAQAEEMLNVLFGDLDLGKLKADLQIAQSLGEETDYTRALDSDGDGQLDDPETLRTNVNAYMETTGDGRLPSDTGVEYDTETQATLDTVGDYIGDDGILSTDEVDELLELTIDEQPAGKEALIELLELDPSFAENLSGNQKAELTEWQTNDISSGGFGREDINETRLNRGQYWEADAGELAGNISQLEGLLESGPAYLNRDLLERKLNYMTELHDKVVTKQANEEEIISQWQTHPKFAKTVKPISSADVNNRSATYLPDNIQKFARETGFEPDQMDYYMKINDLRQNGSAYWKRQINWLYPDEAALRNGIKAGKLIRF